MISSVFISYAKTDGSKRADDIAKILDELNIKTFRYEFDLHSSEFSMEDIRERIVTTIKQFDAIIFILSKKGKDSLWISYELGVAEGASKPCYIFKTAVNLNLPEYLRVSKFIFNNKYELYNINNK